MAEKRTKADKLQRSIDRTEKRMSARLEESKVEREQEDQTQSPKEQRAA